MEKTRLSYSTKNIPVPRRKLYQQVFISKLCKFQHKVRWKTFIYLHPEKFKPTDKETYKFNSTDSAPYCLELDEFETKLENLLTGIKFGRLPNLFQKKVRRDQNRIREENRLYVKGDKTSNIYLMEAEDYCNLVDKEVQKEYKKANSTEILAVKNSEIDIVKKLKLEDRVIETSERQCFATLKDHKANFVNNPKVRLIDPTKIDVG